MQERINFVITDLNDYNLTTKQLCTLFEKILFYYSEKDIDKLENLINGFFTYFYLLYDLIEKSKGEQNE